MTNKDILRAMRAMESIVYNPWNQNEAKRNTLIVTRRLEGCTLGEIGQELSITRERVRQLQARILKIVPPKVCEALIEIIWKPSEKSEIRQVRSEGGQVRAILKTGFDYQRLLEISGTTGRPSEKKLCEILHKLYRISRFGKYNYCWKCMAVKHKDDFMPSVARRGNNMCRECNTKRMARYYHEHGGAERNRRFQQANRDKVSIYGKRNRMKKQGRYSEMPPLPSRGKGMAA